MAKGDQQEFSWTLSADKKFKEPKRSMDTSRNLDGSLDIDSGATQHMTFKESIV